MASLREIKDHIGSVRSTLKITSAMKLVSSAKLRKAQQAAEGIRPYTEALAAMLAKVMGALPSASGKEPGRVPQGEPGPGIAAPKADASAQLTASDGFRAQNGGFYAREAEKQEVGAQNGPFYAPTSSVIPSEAKESTEAKGSRVAIVAVASNSSLCGAFNVNVVRRVLDEVAALRKGGAEVEVFAVGRKMAEAMRKAGVPVAGEFAELVGRNSFDKSAAFAQTLINAYNSGRYSRILFIYNHFVSTSSQKVTVETYLPFGAGPAGVMGALPSATAKGPDRVPQGEPGSGIGRPYADASAPPIASDESRAQNGGFYAREAEIQGGRAQNGPFYAREGEDDYILEPSREEILATLLPQVMRLRVYTVLLDSIAAEHAARTIAMQTASDNAEDLLAELTLEYNKGRQQKITSEILDLVGGAQQ